MGAGSSAEHMVMTESSQSSNEDINRIIEDLEMNVLRERFGLDKLKDSQRVVLDKILRQQSCLAIFPTGFGKSLLYMLPAEIFSGLTIVVSPLLALMRDQVQMHFFCFELRPLD
jgi:superfamily II DNA helicase RecQ